MEHFSIWDFIWDFMVMTVLIKAIAAHYVAQQVIKLWKKMIGSTERNTAIWQHYNKRALGNGHQNDDVLTCHDDGCRVFA